MEINRNAEVAVHGIADDIEWHLERYGHDDWRMVVVGIANIEARRMETRRFTLTDAQASATLALFIGDSTLHDDLSASLYEIAECVWRNVPQHLRPIP